MIRRGLTTPEQCRTTLTRTDVLDMNEILDAEDEAAYLDELDREAKEKK